MKGAIVRNLDDIYICIDNILEYVLDKINMIYAYTNRIARKQHTSLELRSKGSPTLPNAIARW